VGQDASGRYRAKRASVTVAGICGWPPQTAGIKAGHVRSPCQTHQPARTLIRTTAGSELQTAENSQAPLNSTEFSTPLQA
jgi:hypothetical protein